MKSMLSALMLVAFAALLQPAYAADTAKPKANKKKLLPASLSHPKPSTARHNEANTFDVATSSAVEFHCELGRKLTVYNSTANHQQIGLRWKNKLHRLDRVETKTGADRFENSKDGLVWIVIPSKSMLLDSRKGQQLANECLRAPPSQQAANS